MDDSGAYYHQFQRGDGTYARRVVVKLTLAPYGIAENPVTLQNDMFSSPHFVEDSNADGLADGWTLDAGGNSAAVIATTNWLIGGQAQRFNVTADAESQEIKHDDVTAADDDTVVAYIWIATDDSTDDTVYIQLRDGASTLLSEVAFDPSSPAGYDKTITSPSGGSLTWYRYVLSDDGSPARGSATIRFWVRRKSADVNQISSYFLDGAYIEIEGANGIVAPDAWMSARNIDNRGDIEATTQATENHLNYWDVWGVPGDVDALVEIKLDWENTSVFINKMIIGQIRDGKLMAADEIIWIEDNDFTTGGTLDSTWTQPSDAARSAGQYRRLTESGAGSTGDSSLTIAFTDSQARSFLHNPKRIMLVYQSRSSATEFEVSVYTHSTSVF